MTGINKDLKDCTYEEIASLKLKNTDNYIPLFKDVLKIVNGKVPLLIELKSDNRVGRLEKEVMKELKNYKGKYAIQSFHPLTLLYLKKHYPDIIRGQLSCNFNNEKINPILKYLLKNMFFNFITKPDFVSYGIDSIPNKNVERFRKKHLVLGWTIKTKADIEKAKKYCDNYIFENVFE
jgi:glycerophosphoryl diester phosphodiesterase